MAGNQQPIDSFPDGQQVEVFTMRALTQAHNEATRKVDIEHVTPYINQQPDKFAIVPFFLDPPQKHFRWTLDEAADLEFITQVFDALYPSDSCVVQHDVVTYHCV